jgi:uncharacterized membrane protein YedE/YeeE
MKNLAVLVGGLIFGAGLAISGMVQQEVVLSFLQLKDLGLLLVLGAGSIITMLTYSIVPRILKKPLFGGEFRDFCSPFNKRVLFGGALFGAGWGLSGLCPGSAIASAGVGNFPVLIGIATMFLGAYIYERWW